MADVGRRASIGLLGALAVAAPAAAASKGKGKPLPPITIYHLEGRRSEEQREELHRPMRLKREVRKVAVVAERDAHAGREKEEDEHADLEDIETVGPDIPGHCGERGEKSAAKEEGVLPAEVAPGNAHVILVGGSLDKELVSAPRRFRRREICAGKVGL